MSTTIVTRAHHEFTPLTTPRMCHDELKHLALEIRRSEKVEPIIAQRKAIRMMRDLEDYRVEWEPAGLP